LLRAGGILRVLPALIGNKRVWRGPDEIDFWAGQKLATYQVSTDSTSTYLTLTSTNVYFGGKLISKGSYSAGWTDKVALAPVVADRLGSIQKFYSYGTERPSDTGNDKEKFTGCYPDAPISLDYFLLLHELARLLDEEGFT